MSIIDITPPPIEPVSLVSAKEFLRVDGSDEDALITDLSIAARERIEFMAHTSLITRRRAFSSHRVQATNLFLNHSPVKHVHKVSVVDGADNATEIPLERIFINKRATPVSICMAGRDKIFSDYAADPAAIVVEFDAGYGTSPEDVPMQLRQALLLLLAQSYECRDEAAQRPVPMMVDALLMPYRTVRL